MDKLSPDVSQIFKAFSGQVVAVGDIVAQDNPDITQLRSRLLTCQQQFQQQIMPLSSQTLDGAIGQKLQQCQTEMNRLLRLLNTDISFLQAAHQSTTKQQRQNQMRQRIDQLQALVRWALPENSAEPG